MSALPKTKSALLFCFDQTDDQALELWTGGRSHVEVGKVMRRDTVAKVLDDPRATEFVRFVLADWPLTVVSAAPLLEEARRQLRNNLTASTIPVVARSLPRPHLPLDDGPGKVPGCIQSPTRKEFLVEETARRNDPKANSARSASDEISNPGSPNRDPPRTHE